MLPRIQKTLSFLPLHTDVECSFVKKKNVQIDKSANFEFFAFEIEVWIILEMKIEFTSKKKIILLQCAGLNHVHLLHFHGFDITPERFSFFNLKVKRS